MGGHTELILSSALLLPMTKSEAVSALENIERVLKSIESHDAHTPLDHTDLQQRAHRERRKVQDIISLVKKLDRAARAE
ncbi:MAG: hypothetical protein JWQ49_638 [Edaphobacter sp.]|nr:hypothetical protein [Edaphobacter sp.]